MSGKITIDGETWELKPLKGLSAIRKMPKVLGMASRLINAAIIGGIPLDKWLTGVDAGALKLTDAIAAIGFVADELGDSYAEFEKDVVPFLLQKSYSWLSQHGTPYELFVAIIESVKFHLETSFGEDVMAALKNSQTAEEPAAQSSQTD